VKYSRAWWAKQCAVKLIYGDWAEAYECLLDMLHAMKANNSGMHFEYVSKPDIMGSEGRQYFLYRKSMDEYSLVLVLKRMSKKLNSVTKKLFGGKTRAGTADTLF
jgi:hypothetical protein